MKTQKGTSLDLDNLKVDKLISENDELISIFVASNKKATAKLK